MSAVVVTLDLSTNPIGWGEVERAEMIRSLRAEKTLTGAWLADQIEAQTKPPKPAEPTGLGAVVEDADGRKWVRLDDGRWIHSDSFPVRKWAEVAAVRVLSEGVS